MSGSQLQSLLEQAAFAAHYRAAASEVLTRYGLTPAFQDQNIGVAYLRWMRDLKDFVDGGRNPFTGEHYQQALGFLCFHLCWPTQPLFLVGQQRGRSTFDAPRHRELLARYPLQYIALHICLELYNECCYALDRQDSGDALEGVTFETFGNACEGLAVDHDNARNFLEYFRATN